MNIFQRVLGLFVGQDRVWRLGVMQKAFGIIFFYKKSFFSEIGWLKSFEEKMPIDQQAAPLPWVTYSFIDFIQPRLRKNINLFEYGSGNSTLYYAKYVQKVVAVEHDLAWYEKVKDQIAENVELHYTSLEQPQSYVNKPLESTHKFELVIVDGRKRNACMTEVINVLTADGVVVLDDSEREKYQEGKSFLLEKGFKEITFTGIAPGMFLYKSTTVFYRTQNCLNI